MDDTKDNVAQPRQKFRHVFRWVQPYGYEHSWEGPGIWDSYIPDRDVLPVNIKPTEMQLLLTLAHRWHWKFSPIPAEIRRLMGYRSNGAMYRGLKSLRRLGLIEWLEPQRDYKNRIARFKRGRNITLMAERTLHLTERGMHVASVYIGVVPLTKPLMHPEVVVTSHIGYKRRWRRLASPRLTKSRRKIYARRSIFGYTSADDRGGV